METVFALVVWVSTTVALWFAVGVPTTEKVRTFPAVEELSQEGKVPTDQALLAPSFVEVTVVLAVFVVELRATVVDVALNT